MQLYALENNSLIAHTKAEKQKNYFCPECSSVVRLRSGRRRQAHFFHLKPNKKCNLAQKGENHLYLQKFLKKILVLEDPEMEKAFPSIGRIADIACSKTKKIFEIQCSPISLEEVKNRCQDYQSLGYQVIWILHDKRYNKRRVTLAEQYLRSSTTTYFSDMEATGQGIIYDQYEQIANHRRRKKGIVLPVNLQRATAFEKPPFRWTLFHEGDAIDATIKGKLLQKKKKRSFHPLKILINFYLVCFHQLLEKASK